MVMNMFWFHPCMHMLRVCVLVHCVCIHMVVHKNMCTHTCGVCKHTHSMRMHAWTYRKSFMPITCYFTFLSLIFVQYDPYALIFVFFKAYEHT